MAATAAAVVPEEDTELRDLLVQTLENSGVLNRIKVRRAGRARGPGACAGRASQRDAGAAGWQPRRDPGPADGGGDLGGRGLLRGVLGPRGACGTGARPRASGRGCRPRFSGSPGVFFGRRDQRAAGLAGRFSEGPSQTL